MAPRDPTDSASGTDRSFTVLVGALKLLRFAFAGIPMVVFMAIPGVVAAHQSIDALTAIETDEASRIALGAALVIALASMVWTGVRWIRAPRSADGMERLVLAKAGRAAAFLASAGVALAVEHLLLPDRVPWEMVWSPPLVCFFGYMATMLPAAMLDQAIHRLEATHASLREGAAPDALTAMDALAAGGTTHAAGGCLLWFASMAGFFLSLGLLVVTSGEG